jgi:predicted ArsR family transcriptional regulator
MAKEIGRRFDSAAAAVVVTIEDDLGARCVHTIYALRADGTEEDVEGVVAKAIADAQARAEKVKAAFRKAGWKG